MSAPLGNPIFTATDDDGAPLAGGKLYAYAAGTSTPQNTYTDSFLGTANSNPVILDSAGRAEVWCPDTYVYKFVLADSTDAVIWTIDNVAPGSSYPSPYPDGFQPETRTFAFLSGTTFQITGVDATGTYTAGRAVKTTNSGGTVYSIVVSSVFSTNTTVTVANFNGGALDSGLSAISYGLATENSPLPEFNSNTTHVAISGSGGTLVTATDAVLGDTTYTGTKLVDTLSELASNGRFTPKVAGYYKVTANASVLTTGVTFTVAPKTMIAKNGSADTAATYFHATPITGGTQTAGGAVSYVYSLAITDYLDVRLNTTFSGGTPTPVWAFSIERIA